MGSHLRYHRKKTGLTQRDLAEIVGSIGPWQVGRHENSQRTPSFSVAIGYQIVLRATVAELFPELVESLSGGIEERLTAMEQRLHESTAKGHRAAEIARKLEWFEERRNPELHQADHEP